MNINYKQPNFKKLSQDFEAYKDYPASLTDSRCVKNPYSVNEVFLFLQNLNRRRNLI